MKIKNRIRYDISQIFNILIPENKWEDYLDLLDRDGHPNRAELLKLVLSFSKHIEVLEETVDDLYFKIELLEGKTGSVKPEKVDFKLRTPNDVQGELAAKIDPDTKYFHLPADDWKLLEKTLDPQLAKTKPEYGYGKEINPKTNKEEVCLFFRDLPVFKE